MGVPGLWDILGEGEVVSLAQLSTNHWKTHKRPLRVAIDEAGWRFHNLSDAQVALIRQKVPEANPIEKAILWRVLKLMRMNIQPIFVFDGPSRPWKRGGVAGRIDWKKIDLLRKTLNMLKIPHHRAPAEAEAECARLNELGIVDAVWTDDDDAFMFGAKVLIKEHREGRGNAGKKSDNLVRIYRAEDIERKHRINRQGLVLFALLSGGDYDTKGLPGCGPTAALAAAQFDHGRLGRILCETPLRQLHCFTESLRDYFKMPGTENVYVPPGYPRDLHVKNYREPKVSSFEQANNLRGLKDGWYKPIDEKKLRPFLLAMFNIDTKQYLKHILPLLLLRELVTTPPETVEKNLVFDIQLVQKRGRDHDADCLERQITFNPKKCTEENLWKKPDNEDWKEDFDPTAPVETEFLEYVLVGALGEIEMQRLQQLASQPKPRKRKATDTTAEETSSQTPTETAGVLTAPAAKRQKKISAAQADVGPSGSTKKTASNPGARQKPTKKQGGTIQPAEDPQPVEAPTPPVRKTFQLPRALVRNPSMLSELTSQSSQNVLSRSTSFQSVDSTGEPSRSVPASQDLDDRMQRSQETEVREFASRSISHPQAIPTPTVYSRPSTNSQANGRAPPSSQLDPTAQSWTFDNLALTTACEDEPTPKRSSALAPNVQAAQQIRPAVFHEETPSPEPMPPQRTSFIPDSIDSYSLPWQPPVKSRGCVVVNILSDDEDKPPAPAPSISNRTAPAPPTSTSTALDPPASARPAPSPPPTVSHAPAPPAQSAPRPVQVAPVTPAMDSRQAIAAARLKHFEKKVHETIDLTLDD